MVVVVSVHPNVRSFDHRWSIGECSRRSIATCGKAIANEGAIHRRAHANRLRNRTPERLTSREVAIWSSLSRETIPIVKILSKRSYWCCSQILVVEVIHARKWGDAIWSNL